MRCAGELCCIVVHHRNFPDVLDTVTDLLHQGIASTDILVVDNSGDRDLVLKLRSALPEGVQLEIVPNRGYGHAANAGLDAISRRSKLPSSVLISTHETRIREGSIAELAGHLEADEGLAAVGPLLVQREEPFAIWSAGGKLSPLLRRPVHVLSVPSTPSPRDWLDGAFVLYRYAPLASRRFDELYEMYFEETDLHLKLSADGWRIAVVPTVVVAQSTNGTPPRYLGRNAFLFSHRHSGDLRLAPYLARESLRLWVRGDARSTRLDAQREFWKGVLDGWRATKKSGYAR